MKRLIFLGSSLAGKGLPLHVVMYGNTFNAWFAIGFILLDFIWER